MSAIGELCSEITSHLTRLGLKTEHNLLPGASPERIQQLTSGLPFVLPRAVLDLYRWSEGQVPRAGTGSEFFPGYGLPSLAEMVDQYQELSTSAEFPRFHAGDRRWFPLFQSEGTDFYGVYCDETPVDDAEIVDDDNEGPHRDCVTQPEVAYVGLQAMLNTFVECFRSDVFFLDDEGHLEVGVSTYFDEGPLKGCLKDIDDSEFREVARRFNPGLSCWQ